MFITLLCQLPRTSRNTLYDWSMHPFGLRGLQPYDWLIFMRTIPHALSESLPWSQRFSFFFLLKLDLTVKWQQQAMEGWEKKSSGDYISQWISLYEVLKTVLEDDFPEIKQIAAHPRCKNLLCSRVTQNKENKEVKTIERMNIIVTKQRKTSQVLTPR